MTVVPVGSSGILRGDQDEVRVVDLPELPQARAVLDPGQVGRPPEGSGP
jgi:hypothetical protein